MNPFTLRFSDDLESAFLDDYFEKSLKHVRIALLSGLFLYAFFGIMDRWLMPEASVQTAIIRYAIVCPFLLAFFFYTYSSHFKRHMQTALCFPILIPGFGLIAMMVIFPPSANYYYAGLMLIIIYSFTFVRLRFVYATFVASILIVSYEVTVFLTRPDSVVVLLNNSFLILSATYVGMFVGYLIEQYFRRDFIHDLLLEAEREKSERLLLNILPKSIADRLKDEDKIIADGFAEATVIFADIAGFTKMSASIPPEEVVAMLNEVFSAFDLLAEKHRVEKIKTIGDAYMGVGGLPVPRPDHAEAVAELALDMQVALARLNAERETSLSLRIGINTGPVVAGVIGTKKFIYDLWGDTVNTASRMESRGVIDRIQVTEETYRRLRDKYEFEERGAIEVKGKGKMCTYLLVGRKSTEPGLSDSSLEVPVATETPQ